MSDWGALVFSPAKRLINSELPQILQHAARALQQAPFGESFEEWASLTPAQWLQLAPILSCLFVGLLLAPLCLFVGGGSQHRNTGSSSSYWLTRLLLLRVMGLIYLSAFLTSAFQSRALFGSLGLLPTSMDGGGRPTPVFTAAEEWLGWAYDDCMLELSSWLGVFLSLQLIFSTVTSALLPAALWVLYLSIVNLGSIVINCARSKCPFYLFWLPHHDTSLTTTAVRLPTALAVDNAACFCYADGWEWLTLEAGFLLIFLCPIAPALRNPFPTACPPPMLVLWLYRWLAFRLMIGAGMSKVTTTTLMQRMHACDSTL